jgi:PAS domain S-box-containing protein
MSRADHLSHASDLMPTTAVWRVDVDGPVRTTDSPSAQVDAIFRYARLAACNDAMARRYGHERADALVGARLTDLLPDVERNREYLHRFIAAGYQLANQESHDVGRDGHARVFMNHVVGLVEDGLVVSAWGTQLDVTAQREQELLLRQSDERLRAAMSAAGMGTWRVDLRSGGNAREETLAQILGIAASTSPRGGTGSAERMHPDDCGRVTRAIDGAIRDGTDVSEDLRIIRSNGMMCWIRVCGRVVTGADRAPAIFTGAVRDITEARRAEAYERLLGLATASLASSPESERTLAEVAASVVPRFAAACAVHFLDDRGLHQIAAAGERSLIADARPVIQAAAYGTPVVDLRVMALPLRARGRVFGAISFLSSATLHSFDADDRSLAVRLADYVALAVDHARLFRDLQQANRVKDDFLATLSHELRTPLNAVLGWTRMLRRGTVSTDRTAAVLDTIERNAAAQVQLVEELLDLSAITAGGLRLSVARVDLRDAIGGAVETIRPAADARSLRVTLTIDHDLPDVAADPARLRQVLWNLLTNAVKFTPPGGLIHIHVARDASGVELTVSDTGQGISAEFLPHVFDAFRQADPSSTRTVGGLGLGLAIVRHIVEAHGGIVAVRSDGPGNGSTFVIRLPAGHAPAGADERLGERGMLRGRRVLAVDDDESTQELVATMLLMYGVSVRTAGRAAQALDILSSWRPDVLLADLAMPGEDGYVLVRRVRALPPPLGAIPAVALTAYTDPQSVQQAFAAGFDAHLGKPLEPHVLADALAKVLHRSHGNR